ncbi:hypothetical protein Tsp_11416 [Trichinella spiralis]|uniref:hypothetical protein n=1 Tax=Trichinella spiralis TaxID=6334 RepID=UPI0001EFE92A|nr:hypothetical protein Tsp_11416 [Trichinella spiralis]
MRYRQERRYCYYTVSHVTYRQQKAENIEDKDDSITHFQGLSRRHAVARTEKQLKQSFQVVSRWKPVYNETPAEFIPEEGKTRRCIPLKINQMFSITRGNISLCLSFMHLKPSSSYH